MALTNAALKEILTTAGVDAEHMKAATAAIMEGHNDSVTFLTEERDKAKRERDTYKADAEKLPGIQKELDDLRAADWEKKYSEEHAALEALKAETAAKETRAAKEKAVRDYLTGKKIDPKAMDAAMLVASGSVDALELKKDGTIRDTAALDALISGPLAPFVTTETVVGAESPPSATVKTTPAFKTLTEAMQYANEHPEVTVNLDGFFAPVSSVQAPANLAATGANVNTGGQWNPYLGSMLMPAM